MRNRMNLSGLGSDIPKCEITNIEKQGFWILVDEKEYFVSFEHFPAFRSASIEKIQNIKRLEPSQIHWLDLDIDIDLASLEFPDSFPLSFRENT
jgi:hypothetical protein